MTEPQVVPVEVSGSESAPIETMEEAPVEEPGIGPVTSDDPQDPALYEPAPEPEPDPSAPPVESGGEAVG
jgi:hypothetical protein